MVYYASQGEGSAPAQVQGPQSGPPPQPRPGIDTPLDQGSWGGFNFQTTPTSGTSLGSQAFAGPQGIGSEAQFILQGSSGAEAALRRGYEMMLREQAGNVAGAQFEDQRRTRASLTSGGISPMLATLIARGRGARAQQDYGGAVASAGSDYETNLASLEKGTGTELAGARQYDLGMLLKAKMGRDAAVAAEPSGLTQIAQAAQIGVGIAGRGVFK